MTMHFKLPCHQQTGKRCSYYSVMISAEITRKSHMNSDEKKEFKRYKNQCAKAGSFLCLSTARFKQCFPNFGVYFNPRGAYFFSDKLEDRYVSPNEIKNILDMGKVVVLNIQNMKFSGTEIVHKPRGEAHSICCIDYDKTRLIFRDSNKCSNTFRKTLRIEPLQKGYDALVDTRGDLDKLDKVIRRDMYVAEMFIADTEELLEKTRLRRSRRNTIQHIRIIDS